VPVSLLYCPALEASRHLLPPLASSLAYANYTTWRQQQQQEGAKLPDVVEGVLPLEDMYKAAEREVGGRGGGGHT
jgi:hypothetical protein